MTEQILLVILAAALAVFLVLSIVAVTAVIRLIRTLQAVADKAEDFVGSAEGVAAMVRQTVGKISLLRFLYAIIDLVHTKSSKKGE